MKPDSKGSLEKEIDRLYQGPLEEFISARATLAASMTDEERTIVKSLRKPSPAAWAINQLYWRSSHTFQRLVRAADILRAATKSAAEGSSADVRAASQAHRESIQEALRRTLDILREAGHSDSRATRQGIQHTLEALPGDEPAGRLTRPLEPRGFEVFADIDLPPGKAVSSDRAPAPPRSRERPPGAKPARGVGASGHPPERKEQAEDRQLVEARVRAEERKHAEERERRLDAELKKAEGVLARAKKEAIASRKRYEQLASGLEKARGEERRARQNLERLQTRLASIEETLRRAEERVRECVSSVTAAEQAAAEARAQKSRRR